MSNRVLNRRGARELMPEEMDQVTGGLPLHTLCGVPPNFSETMTPLLVLERTQVQQKLGGVADAPPKHDF